MPPIGWDRKRSAIHDLEVILRPGAPGPNPDIRLPCIHPPWRFEGVIVGTVRANPRWERWSHPDVPVRIGVPAAHGADHARQLGPSTWTFLTCDLAPWVQVVPISLKLERDLKVVGPFGPPAVEIPAPPSSTCPEGGLSETLGGLDAFILGCGSSPALDPTDPLSSGGLHGRLSQDAPWLVIGRESQLGDPRQRAHFLGRLFGHNRWRASLHRGLRRRDLVEFHTAHKLLLRSHEEWGYRELGHWVGTAAERTEAELIGGYGERLRRVLAVPQSVKGHVNVIQHALGYLRGVASATERRVLRRCLERYRMGLLPHQAVLGLLRYQVDKHDIHYLKGQLYLDPHPTLHPTQRSA